MASRMNGIVLWFDVKKSYGFIKGEDGVDYFAHYSKIEGPLGEFKTLDQGERVTFEPMEVERGPQKKPQAKSIVRTKVGAT